MASALTDAEIKVIRNLRNKKGYAVVIFTEDELDGAPNNKVEDRLVELGWEVIAALK